MSESGELTQVDIEKILGQVFYLATVNQDYIGLVVGVSPDGDMTLRHPVSVNVNYWEDEDDEDAQGHKVLSFGQAFPLTTLTDHLFREHMILTMGPATHDMKKSYMDFFAKSVAKDRLNTLHGLAAQMGVEIKIVEKTDTPPKIDFDPVNTDGKIVVLNPSKTPN